MLRTLVHLTNLNNQLREGRIESSHLIVVQPVTQILRVQSFVVTREQCREHDHVVRDTLVDSIFRHLRSVLKEARHHWLLTQLGDRFIRLHGRNHVLQSLAIFVAVYAKEDDVLATRKQFTDQAWCNHRTRTATIGSNDDVDLSRLELKQDWVDVFHDDVSHMASILTSAICVFIDVDIRIFRGQSAQIACRGIQKEDLTICKRIRIEFLRTICDVSCDIYSGAARAIYHHLTFCHFEFLRKSG